MANFDRSGMTQAGINLMGKAVGGATIQFTRLVLGDGTMTGEILDLKGVVSPKQNVDVTRIERNNSQCTVGAELLTSSVKQGFFWRECGLYAMDPDQGEILYNYAYSTKSDYIAASDSGMMEEILVSMVTAVGTANVDIILDDSMVFATKKEVNNFASQLSGKANKGEFAINVKDYGVKGDGITDDTIALNAILNTGDGLTFYIPSGNYLISSTLTPNTRCCIKMSKNARIFTNTEMENLVVYNDGRINGVAVKSFWTGGILDCNDFANNAITFGNFTNFTFEETQMINFKQKGIVTKSENSTTHGGLMGNKLYFRNWNYGYNGSIAIYNNGQDNKFYDITVVDVETAIDTNFGIFTRIHHWISKMNIFPNSCFAYVRNSYAMFQNNVVDTIRCGFKSNANIQVRANGVTCLCNHLFYTTEVAAVTPFIFFDGDGYIYADNVLAYMDFGNNIITTKASTLHKFVNCRFSSGPTATFDDTNYNPTDDVKYQLQKGSINNPDLDNYKTSGYYKVGTLTNALNLPTPEAGELEVKVFSNPKVADVMARQIYYLHTDERVYYQRYYSSVTSKWSKWAKYESENFGVTVNNPDFNNYKTSNRVYKIMDTDSAINYPVKASGVLVVKASGADGFIGSTQSYYPLAFEGIYYVRTYNESTDTYSPWYSFSGTIVS